MKKSFLPILFLMFYGICTIANNPDENIVIKTPPELYSSNELAMSMRYVLEAGTSNRMGAFNMGNFAESTKVKKDVWIPWFYIAAGASAATGAYSYIKSNSIYNRYPKSADTKESEQYHADAELYDDISKIAFTATAGFAAVGIIVHVKHLKNKKSMSLSYIPVSNGAAFGLTYNF